MMDIDDLFKPTVKVKLDGQKREILDKCEQIAVDGKRVVRGPLPHPRPPLPSASAPRRHACSYPRIARSNEALLSLPSM